MSVKAVAGLLTLVGAGSPGPPSPSPTVSAGTINVINAGRVLESGTHAQLLRRGGLYASLHEEQFEGGRVQVGCADGDVMADGTVRERAPEPA